MALAIGLGTAFIVWPIEERLQFKQADALMSAPLNAVANSSARYLSEKLQAEVMSLQSLAAGIDASFTGISALDTAAMQSALTQQRQKTNFTWLGLMSTERELLAGSDGLSPDFNAYAYRWFESSLDRPTIGLINDALLLVFGTSDPAEPTLAEQIPPSVFYLTVPLQSSDGSPSAILVAQLPTAFLERALSASGDGFEVESYLVDPLGRVIGTRDLEYVPADTMNAALPIRRAHFADNEMYFVAVAPLTALEPRLTADLSILSRTAVGPTIYGTARWLSATMFAAATLTSLLFLLLGVSLARERIRALEWTAHAVRTLGAGGDIPEHDRRTRNALLRDIADGLRAAKQRFHSEIDDMKHQLTERTAQLEEAQRLLVEQAQIDPLTGVAATAAVKERLQGELTRFWRNQEAFCVLVIAITDFAKIKRDHGHAMGDRVLRAVATSIRDKLRGTDFVGRGDGDTVICVLPGTNSHGARHLSEKLKRHLARLELPPVQGISITCGEAEVSMDDGNGASVLERANTQLVAAKVGRPMASKVA